MSCVRCAHAEAEHHASWGCEVEVGRSITYGTASQSAIDEPVLCPCPRYEPPAPWWLRWATAALSRFGW